MQGSRTDPNPIVHRPRPRRLARAVLLGALAVVLAAAAGCSRSTGEVNAGAAPNGAAGGAAAPGAPPLRALPTLPPVESREPDRFDPQGCIRTSPTAADCGQRAAQLDAAAAGSRPEDWRTLAGFVGRDYTEDLSRDAVVVLEETVTTSATVESRWRAMGLVRNEHRGGIGGIAVEATLLDGTGTPIETVRGEALVGDIRPGEPAPFELAAATTPAPAVASVTWRAVATGTAFGIHAPSRQLQLNTYWTRPQGDERAIDMYLHHDRDGDRPYVLFGSALAVGTDVARPHVVLAWRDAAGRVVAVGEADVADPSGAAAPAMRAGQALDFLVTIEQPADAVRAEQAAPMIWGAGR